MPTFLNRFIFDTRLFLPQHDTSNHFREIKPHLLWTEQTVDHPDDV